MEIGIVGEAARPRTTYGFGPTTSYAASQRFVKIAVETLGVTHYQLSRLVGQRGDIAFQWRDGASRPSVESTMRLGMLLAINHLVPVKNMSWIDWNKGTVRWRDKSVTLARFILDGASEIPTPGTELNVKIPPIDAESQRQTDPHVNGQSVVSDDTFPSMHFVQ